MKFFFIGFFVLNLFLKEKYAERINSKLFDTFGCGSRVGVWALPLWSTNQLGLMKLPETFRPLPSKAKFFLSNFALLQMILPVHFLPYTFNFFDACHRSTDSLNLKETPLWDSTSLMHLSFQFLMSCCPVDCYAESSSEHFPSLLHKWVFPHAR